MPSNGLETAALTAQSYHLAANPGEDAQRYVISVLDSARGIRDGLAAGSVNTQMVVSTAQSCNMRYAR